jgi:hypothetical protein
MGSHVLLHQKVLNLMAVTLRHLNQADSGGYFLRTALRHWASFIRYAKTGHLPIDNNVVENCIRPIALSKKNWLFAGSERAGQRAAAIQTLLGTAKLNDLNSEAWLKNTLEKLPTWPNSRIDVSTLNPRVNLGM